MQNPRGTPPHAVTSPQSLLTPVASVHPSPAPQGHPQYSSLGEPCAHASAEPSRGEATRRSEEAMAPPLLLGSVTFLPSSPGCSCLLPGSCLEAAASRGLSGSAPELRLLGPGAQLAVSPCPQHPREAPCVASGEQCPYQEVRLFQKALRQAGLGNWMPPPGSEHIASNWVPAHVRAGRTLPRAAQARLKPPLYGPPSVFNPWQEAWRGSSPGQTPTESSLPRNKENCSFQSSSSSTNSCPLSIYPCEINRKNYKLLQDRPLSVGASAYAGLRS